MSDYQEIRLQHKASGASTAARSAYTELLLEDELADSCQPGGRQAIKSLHSMGFEFSFQTLPEGNTCQELIHQLNQMTLG